MDTTMQRGNLTSEHRLVLWKVREYTKSHGRGPIHSELVREVMTARDIDDAQARHIVDMTETDLESRGLLAHQRKDTGREAPATIYALTARGERALEGTE